MSAHRSCLRLGCSLWNRGWLAALLSLAVLTLAPPAAAHPFHASLAEVELNPDTGHLEVALELPTADLERALTVHARQAVDLDGESADAAILAYLRPRFVVRCDDRPEPAATVWVGKEVEVKTSWLYFEIVLAKNATDCTLENLLLIELEPTQLNTVQLTLPSSRSTVTLSRDQTSLGIPTPP